MSTATPPQSPLAMGDAALLKAAAMLSTDGGAGGGSRHRRQVSAPTAGGARRNKYFPRDRGSITSPGTDNKTAAAEEDDVTTKNRKKQVIVDGTTTPTSAADDDEKKKEIVQPSPDDPVTQDLFLRFLSDPNASTTKTATAPSRRQHGRINSLPIPPPPPPPPAETTTTMITPKRKGNSHRRRNSEDIFQTPTPMRKGTGTTEEDIKPLLISPTSVTDLPTTPSVPERTTTITSSSSSDDDTSSGSGSHGQLRDPFTRFPPSSSSSKLTLPRSNARSKSPPRPPRMMHRRHDTSPSALLIPNNDMIFGGSLVVGGGGGRLTPPRSRSPPKNKNIGGVGGGKSSSRPTHQRIRTSPIIVLPEEEEFVPKEEEEEEQEQQQQPQPVPPPVNSSSSRGRSPPRPMRTHRRLSTSPSALLLSSTDLFSELTPEEKTPQRPPKHGGSRQHRRYKSEIPTQLFNRDTSSSSSSSSSGFGHKKKESSLSPTPPINRGHRRTNSGSIAAYLQSEKSRGKDELTILTESLYRRKIKYGANSPKVAEATNYLGNYHFHKGQYTEALEHYLDALKSYQTSLGDDNVYVAQTMMNIGTVHWRLGEYDLSLKSMQLSGRILHKEYGGKTHPVIGNLLHNMGQVLLLRGNVDEAIVALEQALVQRKETTNLGGLGESVEVARTLGVMATAYLKKAGGDGDGVGEGRKKEVVEQAEAEEKALDMHREALTLKRNTLGLQHPSVVLSMIDVAHTLKVSGQYDASIEMYREALRIQRVLKCSHKISSMDVGMTLHAMGNLYQMKGMRSDAKRRYNEAYIHYRDDGLGDDSGCMMALKKVIGTLTRGD